MGEPAVRGMDGLLRAVVAGPAPGRLVELEHRVPLQVQRLLYPEPGVAHLCLLSPTGGVLQGDRLRVDVRARDGARLHVTTQSATRVYRMPAGEAVQSVRIEAARGSYVEYLPHPLIPFAGSRFSQSLELRASGDGVVVAWDVVVAGRVSRGERWAFDAFSSRVDAFVDGELVLAERGTAAPSPLVSQAFVAVGSLYVLGAGLGALAPKLRERIDDHPDIVGGATCLREDAGAVVRVAAPSTGAAVDALRAAWDAARREVIGLPASDVWP